MFFRPKSDSCLQTTKLAKIGGILKVGGKNRFGED